MWKRLWKRSIQTKIIKKETIEKNLGIPVENEDVEELYNALKEPPKQHFSKLSPDYLQRLDLKFESLSAQLESHLANRSIQISESLSRPTLGTITELIHLNAMTKRVKEAQEAFDTISELGLVPDLVAYNHLLHAYATVGQLDKVKSIFESISSNGLTPDLVSYSTYINCLVENRDINEAIVVYETMKSKGIKPNQIVFCTLIKGCLKAKQFDRAWRTFDHLRSIDTPDGITYSLMINACALTQEAEKALDLFQEMASYNITANEATFNGLIRACGSRKDYYDDAFRLMEQMIQEGFDPSVETYHNLFEIVSRHGDVKRARLIWNDFVKRVDYKAESSVKKPFVPHPGIMGSLLKLYTNAWVYGVFQDESATKVKAILPEKVEIEIDPKPINDDNGLPLLLSTKLTKPALAAEATQIWELTEKLVQEGKMEMNSWLLSARLNMICEIPGEETIDIAYDFFKNKFKQYNVEVMGLSYKTLLRCAWYRKTKTDTALQIWNEFLEWDRELESSLMKECESSPLTAAEREERRKASARQAQVVLDCFYIAARGYCRSGDLSKAIEILEQTQAFRYPFYLPPLHLRHIKNILVAAQSEADDGNLEPLQKLQELIPPQKDSVTQVQSVLRRKYLPSSWWGWTAMGLDDKEKEAMMRKHQRENRKILQKEMELRRKAEVAKRNQKAKLFKPRDDLI